MGFVQGGTVIQDGDNLKIQGVTPVGVAAQGNVIWREVQPWQFLLASTTSAGISPATPPVDTTGADLLVFYSTRVTTATGYTISDSADNIWAQGVSKDYGVYTCTVFYCIHPQTSQQHIFRVNSSSFTTVIIAAFKTPSVISSDQQSAIGVSSAASVQLPTIIPAPNSLVITSLTASGIAPINCGSDLLSEYGWNDRWYTGGVPLMATDVQHPIDTSRVTRPAPDTIYRTCRYGGGVDTGTEPFSYTIPPPTVTPGWVYRVRLHFCECWMVGEGVGRVFNVAVNDHWIAQNFDTVARAGGEFIAYILEADIMADSRGLWIRFEALTGFNPILNGIEVEYIDPPAIDSPFLIVGQVPQTNGSALQAIAYAVADAVPIAPTWTISSADLIIATMLSFKPS